MGLSVWAVIWTLGWKTWCSNENLNAGERLRAHTHTHTQTQSWRTRTQAGRTDKFTRFGRVTLQLRFWSGLFWNSAAALGLILNVQFKRAISDCYSVLLRLYCMQASPAHIYIFFIEANNSHGCYIELVSDKHWIWTLIKWGDISVT